MERRPTGTTRQNWPQVVTDQGLTYWKTVLPTGETRSYWSESAHYAFSAAEVDQMEADQVTLMEMFVAAGDYMLAHPEVTDKMGIPRWCLPMIRATWDRPDGKDWGSIYGRIDVVYGGNRMLDMTTTDLQDYADPALGRIRLYEFNADTPTSALETVLQWAWFEATRQGTDQWNSFYESLVDAWKRNLAEVEAQLGRKPVIHFACTWEDNLLPEYAEMQPEIDVEDCSYEDLQNLRTLQQACTDAGYETRWLYVQNIHLGEDGRFYDGTSGSAGAHLDVVFKLYPWEHMVTEEFGEAVFTDMARPGGTTWIEPPYKMLWSNKGLLPVLWQLFGDDTERSPLLIPAWFDGEQPEGLTTFVRKPILSREGANVTVVVDGETVLDTPGVYDGPKIVQEYAPAPNFPGYDDTDNYPTIGLWYVDGEPAGLDVRENNTVVVDNLSVFVPHVIRN